jgi:putative ABC transport system permease protein
MAMSVRERIREIAVLKTLGFPKNSILALLIGEAVTVTLLGGLIGVFLASLLLFGAAHGPAGQMLGNLRVTPGVFSLALVAAALVGILSGLLPSWRAASQPVVQGLRHVG